MREKKQHIVLKKVLFIGIVTLLFIPMLQQNFRFFEVKPLSGDFKQLEKPSFTKADWWNGKFQEEYQAYVNQKMGFQPLFVRTYNQLHFSLFNNPRASGVIIGKENYLFEEQYIKSYLGEDFIGTHQIEEKIRKLNKIKDTLAQKEINILLVLAPGKGSFYPEFIPDSYQFTERTTTNYEVYRSEILKTDLHFIDFNQYFIENKNTSAYPLMAKTGIHWSKYAELLVADSIINYVNTLNVEFQAPKLLIGEVKTSTKMWDTDGDIEKAMNLLFRIRNHEMAYPEYKFSEKPSTATPRVLTIADSFYWGLFNIGVSRHAFDNGQFWYYNQQVYPVSIDTPKNIEDINIIKEVEKNDVVMILATEGNLNKFAFGFIDQLYEAYFPTNN
ncbi:alginate O-acetyltransferase AlgX-related protein [Brumimicrobium sp.]|uniref:alginate O-acetyltransferase AlgX-related protein n=1 Tax=Brumimicrobium sp. TaxID=2029867 RepID=UPI003A901B78